jgi:hypothetical protein
MTQYIQVGEDVVEFPDDMSDADIEAAIASSGRSVPLMPEKRAATAPSSGFLMGLKDPISGGAQLLPRALSQATSLFGVAPNPLSQYFASEAQRVDEMVRAEQAAYAAQRQAQGGTGFDWARLAGNVVNPANVVPSTFAASLVSPTSPITRALVGGAVGGAMQPVTEGDFTTGKTEQVGIGAVAGPVGERVFAGAGRMLNPLVTKAEQTMRDLGVTPTTGQVLGKGAKSLEEFAQYMPLIGSAIQDARQRTVFNFNKGVINKALDNINTKLPADVIGRDAIEFATQQISDEYTKVLNKMSFNLDFKTSSDILSALNKANLLSAEQRQQAINLVNDVALSKFSGQKLTGEQYKAIESDLRKKAASYINSQSAAEREIGDALQGVLSVFKRSLYDQNPKFTPQLRKVDNAYSDMAVIKIAAANSGADNGVFTPKQFSTAVRQSDKSINKSAFAKGAAKQQNISDAAMQILGDEAGDRLAGRYTAGAFGGAGLFGLAKDPFTTLPLAAGTTAAIRAAYSEPGQRALDALLRSRPESMRAAGRLFGAAAPYAGAAVGPQPVYQYNIQERMLPPVEVIAYPEE